MFGGFCDCCLFCCVWFDAIPIPDDTKDDTMLSPFFKLPTLRTDQLITLPFLFCCVCLFVCLFVCFAFAFVFGCFFCFLLLHPLKWPIVILRLVVLVDFYGPASTWHTSCHLHAPR